MCEGASKQSPDLEKIIPRRDRPPPFVSLIPGTATDYGPKLTRM